MFHFYSPGKHRKTPVYKSKTWLKKENESSHSSISCDVDFKHSEGKA